MAEPPFGSGLSDSLDVMNKTVYLCVGLKQNGLKEVLGMWVGKSESSSF